jgi:bacteriocin-like protein
MTEFATVTTEELEAIEGGQTSRPKPPPDLVKLILEYLKKL